MPLQGYNPWPNLGLDSMEALISGMAAATATWPWSMISAIFGAAAFFVVVGTQIIRPWKRQRRLKHPCKVYFAIPPLQQIMLGHILQDERGHEVCEIVLPSNRVVEIELIICPIVSFQEGSISFGCDGLDEDKPVAVERFDRLIKTGKSRWVPGMDDGYSIDRHGYIQIRTNRQRTKGSRIPIGFKLQTKRAGKYRAHLFFFTEERGEATLTIRVEEAPVTQMRCRVHRRCYISPIGRA